MRLFLLLFLLLSSAAHSEVTTDGFPYCDTYTGLKEIWRSYSTHDSLQYNALMKNEECIRLKPGLQLSVIKKLGEVYKVRVYVEQDSFVMYTNNDGFK